MVESVQKNANMTWSTLIPKEAAAALACFLATISSSSSYTKVLQV